jgi:hypothetical protein
MIVRGALAIVSLLALVASSGCGRTSTVRAHRARTSSVSALRHHSGFETIVLHFGHPAKAIDRRTVSELVTSYYAAAAAENGESACALLDRSMAGSVAEDYGQLAGFPARSPGLTCARVMSKLFAGSHKKLVAESASLRIPQVRLRSKGGYALLSFATTNEPRELTIVREGHTWKISSLFDTGLD